MFTCFKRLYGIVLVAAFVALQGQMATADNGDSQQACQNLMAETYLTTTVASDGGAFAARTLITLHRDGTVAVVSSSQDSGAKNAPFSMQQGAFRCTAKTSAAATTISFGFAPVQNIGRLDWVINRTGDHTIEGKFTLNLFTPLKGCDPFKSETTCEPPKRFDFTFTGVAVPN